jgi:hypothetical protein
VHRRISGAFAISLAIALLGAGCGGGGSGNVSSAGAGGASSLTSAEAIKQANAICKQGGERIHQQVQRFNKAHGLSHKAAVERPNQEILVAKFVVPSVESQAARLAKLEVPKGDKEELTELIFNLGKLAKTAAEKPASMLVEGNGNPLAEANKAAKIYGAEECTQP